MKINVVFLSMALVDPVMASDNFAAPLDVRSVKILNVFQVGDNGIQANQVAEAMFTEPGTTEELERVHRERRCFNGVCTYGYIERSLENAQDLVEVTLILKSTSMNRIFAIDYVANVLVSDDLDGCNAYVDRIIAEQYTLYGTPWSIEQKADGRHAEPYTRNTRKLNVTAGDATILSWGMRLDVRNGSYSIIHQCFEDGSASIVSHVELPPLIAEDRMANRKKRLEIGHSHPLQ